MTNWTSLLTPVVVGLIPFLVAAAKPWIPPRLTVLYPLLATTLGPLGDLALSYLQSRAADPKWGVAMGLMAIGVRELSDQARKIPSGPTISRLLACAVLLPALTGCVALNGPAMYVKCTGKGALTGTAALGGGLLYGGGGTNTGTLQADCGDGFEYYRGPKKPKSMPAEVPK